MSTTGIVGRNSGTRSLGIGIVGLSAAGGWAAAGHVPALQAVDGVELRGLAASSAASGHAAGMAYGVPAYTSVEQLAAADDIDMVVIAVKVPAHRELVLSALNAEVPVLCEWPFAKNLPEAEEMAGAAVGIRTFVGLQGRTLPTVRWVADLVAGGYVGEVLSTTIVMASDEWGNPISERERYTLDRKLGATMLAIAFGHAIDLVSSVVGELREVVATTATRHPRVALGRTGQTVSMTAFDQIAVSGTLPGGAVLSVHHRGGVASGAAFTWAIDGTEGTLEISAPGHPHLSPLTVRGAKRGARPAEMALPDGYDDYASLGGPIHSLAHAYDAIRDDLSRGDAVVPDFDHAVRRHRLLDAIVRAATTGRRVSL
ncbi:Gfo/Idh/MocA family protein [Mycolicibacterium mengxianglii]|uniref:Gfo/Idh/MocA family protein n=1 Tax=Mycolicibacterium mengxianglii TaxID=2736649 RepID=UPI0018EF2962|nr:Gfo/Idh/MocA family oxidoreductase [Mycolicibacterium mengxianglii]